MIHIPTVKKILAKAGYAVSKGEAWIAQDIQNLEHYAFHVWGITKQKLHYGLNYLETLPQELMSLFGHSSSTTPNE